MKKLLFILLLINGITFSQMKPGIDYMPHIGFFDFVVNYLSNPNDHLANQPAIFIRYNSDNWYFDSLISLGLTNLVTDAQYHQNLNHTLDNFYLNDMGFAWKHDPSLNPPLNFLPARFMNSLGHKEESYVLQLGNDNQVSTISFDHNFGFGVSSSQANTASYWVLKPGVGQPLGIDSTGINGSDNQVNPPVYSRMALTQYHTPGEAIMWAKLPTAQFPIKDSLKIRILLRRGQAPSNSVTLFTINATSIQGEPKQVYNIEGRRDHRKLEVEPETTPTLFVQEVTANDLNNGFLTAYDWFESNTILIDKDKNFEFNIIWSGNADLFIDKIMVYNTAYDVLYVDKTITMDDINDDLKNRYLVGSIVTDPYFQSFYFDEPFQLSAHFRGKLQDTISTIYSGSRNFELNSAVGGAPKHLLDFDNKYARPEENSPIFKNYLLYNMYPIDKNTTTTTSSIQHRFDVFCNYNNVGDSLGDPYELQRYKYVGLLNAQLAAKEAGIPFVMTLGVHSEQYILNTNGKLSIVDGDHKRRPPTKDEIFAMGNLALAYGAKGFMYYMIPTRAHTPVAADETVWNTYGLFDEIDKAFSLNNPSSWCQNPANPQVPNNRFYAVKEFIQSTKLIENTLLGLDWQSAHNWSRYPLESDWISDVSSWYRHIDTADSWDKTFVETGNFKGDESGSGNIEAPKYIYMVNRRCNIQPKNSLDNIYDYADTSSRYIKFNLNFPNSNWDYYTVKDLKTDSLYFTTKTGDVTIFLGAGEGTLLKIEPQITSITQNDTLGYNTTFYSDLTVSNNATLTIEDGVTLTFENHSRLLLSNGNLTVNGTAQKPVVFDFVTPYWQSTTNGIVNNYGSVVLNHAKIKNAAVGYYSYSTDNDDIQNSEIFNNQWGIVMHWTHSYGTEKAKIINCNIHDNSTWDNQGRGITLSNSSPKIYATTIRKNDYGLYCVTNSNPYDTIDEVNGYNVIDSNDVGIITLNSTPMLGYVDDEQGGILISRWWKYDQKQLSIQCKGRYKQYSLCRTELLGYKRPGVV
jgi:hypothetical protein